MFEICYIKHIKSIFDVRSDYVNEDEQYRNNEYGVLSSLKTDRRGHVEQNTVEKIRIIRRGGIRDNGQTVEMACMGQPR